MGEIPFGASSDSNSEPSAEPAAAGPSEGSAASAAAAPLAVGSLIELRKPHACGGKQWTVTRTGADIGLECTTCRRRIMLARDEFNRRLSERRS